MEDFIRFLVTPLLTLPDQLVVKTATSTVTLHIAPDDMGRVIGKHGNIISALRNLLRLYCSTHNLPPQLLSLSDS